MPRYTCSGERSQNMADTEPPPVRPLYTRTMHRFEFDFDDSSYALLSSSRLEASRAIEFPLDSVYYTRRVIHVLQRSATCVHSRHVYGVCFGDEQVFSIRSTWRTRTPSQHAPIDRLSILLYTCVICIREHVCTYALHVRSPRILHSRFHITRNPFLRAPGNRFPSLNAWESVRICNTSCVAFIVTRAAGGDAKCVDFWNLNRSLVAPSTDWLHPLNSLTYLLFRRLNISDHVFQIKPFFFFF